MPTLTGSQNTSGLITEFTATSGRLAEAVRSVSDDALDSAPEDEWPARTILAQIRTTLTTA